MIKAGIYLLAVLVSPFAVGGDVLSVYTVNYPLAYFAQRIGGEHVDVQFPAPGDVDPAFWVPDIQTIGRYQKADLILLNGAGYAKWSQKVSLPRLRTVNTSKKFTDQYITDNNGLTHSHGPAGAHAHSGTAFTTWLDFRQAILQASEIMQVLIRKQPQHEARFAANYAALQQDLQSLDDDMVSIIARNPQQPMLASHPVYQYLARRYHIDLKSVLWEPDELPEPEQWASLSRLLKTHPAPFMIWEAKPMVKTAQKLAQDNVRVVVFEPCANVPQDGDFMSVMRRNIHELRIVYSP